ncbi:hypothetical protein L284_03095 [Novosphingobium lindaniclasticum LE124]|uniref:Conjugative transfer protein GumN n=2 Tax=Novosphingobium TaxID=165696 RepID=T0JAD8_9SPHN|nr:hypothetical protein L284_03095 [Novosphingobium lindaniclasticum LE124]
MMLLRLHSLLSFQGNPMIFSSARRLRLTAFVPLFLFAPPVLAQAAPAAMAEARPETAAPDHPALWKIADQDTTIYLFGTIHILPENADWFHGPVKAAFDAADLLVTETAVNAPQTLQNAFMEKGLRRDGKTLRESLNAKEREKFEKSLSDLHLPLNIFDQFQPWYAGLLLTLLPLKAAGYDQSNGIETQIEAKAAARNLSGHPLETADYQIGLFAGLPEKSQLNYLNEVVEQLPTLREDIAKLVQAWKTGRAEELAELLNEDESDELMRKVLLSDRNKAWAKWLKARMDEPGVVFVAVGAGHLAGRGSVQDELAKVGFRSVRVQ